MPAQLKAALKVLGYLAFFVVALVGFIYLTLPVDAVRDYLVRKASDEYNADLEIMHLSTWGLSGVEMEGVTLTPRPTPEERTRIQAAQAARKAWRERKNAQAAAATEAAGDAPTADDPAAAAAAARAAREKGDDKKSGGEGKEKTADAKGAEADGQIGSDGDSSAAAAKPKPSAKEDKPPPLPEMPQPLYVESLRARVGLFDLLGDLTNGKVFDDNASGELEATLLGGTINAQVTRNAEQVDLDAQFSGLDLRQLTVLRNMLPLPLAGDFEGEVDLELPLDDDGGLRMASTTGFVQVSLSSAEIGPGRIESDKLRNFGGFFDVPRLRLAAFGGKVNFEKRRATFDEFAFRGKDIEGDLTGYVQLANKIERFNPRAYLRFKFSEGFLGREKGIGVLMRTVPEIKRGTGGDGFTGFAVSMKTDRKTRQKALSWRPTPRNPYGPRTRPGSDDTSEKGTKRAKRGSKRIGTRPGRAKPPRSGSARSKSKSKSKSKTKPPPRPRRDRKAPEAPEPDSTETDIADEDTEDEDGEDEEEGGEDEEEGGEDEEEGGEDEEEGDE